MQQNNIANENIIFDAFIFSDCNFLNIYLLEIAKFISKIIFYHLGFHPDNISLIPYDLISLFDKNFPHFTLPEMNEPKP